MARVPLCLALLLSRGAAAAEQPAWCTSAPIDECTRYAPAPGAAWDGSGAPCVCTACTQMYTPSADERACGVINCTGTIEKCTAENEVGPDGVCTCSMCNYGYSEVGGGTSCEKDDGSGSGSLEGARDVPLLPWIIVVATGLVFCMAYVFMKSREGGDDHDDHHSESDERYTPIDEDSVSIAGAMQSHASHLHAASEAGELDVPLQQTQYAPAQAEPHQHLHTPSPARPQPPGPASPHAPHAGSPQQHPLRAGTGSTAALPAPAPADGLPPGGFVANTPMGPMYVVPTPRGSEGGPRVFDTPTPPTAAGNQHLNARQRLKSADLLANAASPSQAPSSNPASPHTRRAVNRPPRSGARM